MRITRKTSSLDELVESYVKERGDLSPATLSSFRDSVKVFKDNGLESLEDVPSVVEKIKGKYSNCFAREWVKNGGSAFELQTLLCHSSLEMTKRYVQLYGSDIDVNRNNFINKYVSKTIKKRG